MLTESEIDQLAPTGSEFFKGAFITQHDKFVNVTSEKITEEIDAKGGRCVVLDPKLSLPISMTHGIMIRLQLNERLLVSNSTR